MVSDLDAYAKRLGAASTAVAPLLRQLGATVAVELQAGAVERITARLQTRTGLLRRSAKGQAKLTGDTLEVRLTVGGRGGGKELAYAQIQEEGGVVRPTRSKYLAIPVGPARTGAGAGRYASPRDVPGLTFVQSRRGQPLLVKAETTGKGKRQVLAGTVYYILRRSVRISGKHFARDAWAAVLPTVEPRLHGLLGALLEVR